VALADARQPEGQDIGRLVDEIALGELVLPGGNRDARRKRAMRRLRRSSASRSSTSSKSGNAAC
jgi:hypothetical protein